MPVWLEPVATALAALAAIGSLFVAWRVWKSQEKITMKSNEIHGKANKIFEDLRDTTKKLEGEANDLRKHTNDLYDESNRLKTQISDKETLLTQRAQLVPIWQYWSTINHIQKNSLPLAKAAQVSKAVNILELVALCWEADIIDRSIITRTFRDTFIEIYDEIEECPDLDFGNNNHRTGKQILNENHSTQHVYTEFHKQIDEERAGRAPPRL